MTGTPDVAVLRTDVHGLSMADYADRLRERLPNSEVYLARTPAEERDYLARVPVATGLTIDADLVAASDLELFACAFAGYDHLPMDTLEAQGVAVTTASGVHGPNVAEHVLGFLLSFARGLPEAWRRQRRREWRHFRVGELAGSTAVVVGLGAIGEAVVRRLEGFDVETVGVRADPAAGGPADEVLGPDRLHDALARADYLVLACPLTEETRGLVGARELDTLSPEAVVVNVARGPVVETEALVSALRNNAIGGAALDVTDPEPLPEDHPLWGFQNVLITPHNAGFTPRYFDRLADIVAENVERLAAGDRGLRNQVLPR